MPYIQLNPATAAAAPVTSAGAPLTSVGETLSSLQANLAIELGNRGDVDPTRTAGWINMAYRYLCSILTIKELYAQVALNLVAGQPLYLIPDAVSSVRELVIQDAVNYPHVGGVKLAPMELDVYRKLPDDTLNLPGSFFREQRLIGIYPTPRASYTAILDFKVRPSDLVNPTDSPILPPELHEALMLRAKHVAFRALKDYTASAIARNDLAADIRSIEDTDAREKAEMPIGLRPIRSARELNRLYNTRSGVEPGE